MAKSTILMPKAVAIWLVENTSLTFDQIADFCNLHRLEIDGIADGDISSDVAGCNPITMGHLSREEIERCQNDPSASLTLVSDGSFSDSSKKGSSKYVPMARRRDKPDAICWLTKNCPELSDSQIAKLVGTTKRTIASIRKRTHWNIENIKPRDPVLLELCTHEDLDDAVMKARIAKEKEDRLRSYAISGSFDSSNEEKSA